MTIETEPAERVPGRHELATRAILLRYINEYHADAFGSVRCGMGDAATLLDAIIRDMAVTGRNSKRRREDIALVKRLADAIWAMREMVLPPQGRGMDPPTPPPAVAANLGGFGGGS